VKITADNWGKAGDALANAYTENQGHTDDSSSSESGSAGFLGFGGSAAHSQYDYNGNASNSASDDWGWSFNKTGEKGTLTINGSQIVGFIGEIVPACPTMDDPGLPKGDTKPSSGQG
jgi:hypothetical protein